MDYLPLNAEKGGNRIGNYVLVEEKTPEGFETADPKAIVLTETGNVQRISLENEEKYINVLKVVSDGTREYAAAGAKLALYRADEAGNLAEDETHMVEAWISGSDGKYTENDRFNGALPDGFSVGDLKPHRIDQIPYGTYYIAELGAPDYMKKAEPLQIIVGADKVPFYKVINTPAMGKLEIRKKASDTGEDLEHARFKVTNKDTGAVWYITTGSGGKAEQPGLPTGVVQTDGTVKAYTYTLEEISPPDLYQISERAKTFQFNGKEVIYACEIVNDPTSIQFKKTDFHTGMAVKGAEIAVYEAVAVDGEYQKNGEAIATMTSGPDGFTLTKKLSANLVYIMEERKAPAGYALSETIIFTVNEAGTGIYSVSSDFHVLKLADENEAIKA